MTRWFRVYVDLVDDPKVQRLDAALFKALINLWCLASANDGALPPIDEIAFKLRMKREKAQRVLTELRAAGLIAGAGIIGKEGGRGFVQNVEPATVSHC